MVYQCAASPILLLFLREYFLLLQFFLPGRMPHPVKDQDPVRSPKQLPVQRGFLLFLLRDYEQEKNQFYPVQFLDNRGWLDLYCFRQNLQHYNPQQKGGPEIFIVSKFLSN